MRAAIAIPVRLESSRLPRKALCDIGGMPMIHHVLERSSRAKRIDRVVLCTDSIELQYLAKEWGFPVLMTSSSCSSGTDRIASVIDSFDEDLIINVQGDQPFIDPEVIDQMIEVFELQVSSAEVLTPIYRLSSDKIHNPNVVKTLVSSGDIALYFSRSAVPHVRDVVPDLWGEHAPYWGHIGIYGFHRDVLVRWPQLPESSLEKLEKLEQLRLIESGINVGVFKWCEPGISVDTPEDLAEARRIFAIISG
ncbi:3-deoxy-manno-octulosonate cytidylyltransferase [Neosynechococcus sphagnicola sy1]|uniref:3-deoxy-manno-octulosonate cytidylyltransferase n=1 Tax=Neosynechococcus sphagnicola sy1 TaxID=1497020 RepID=A0A098TIH0_9CYAN|nr:3-deoxy-manno-octulosonate cytidylyltransferase [Neosynechococcus sphagnicola]KGF71777.1 3-deoxy-manno-octulosonate cytidylyltransferase [Neosynechococcus sphagnicola sy1]